MWIAFRHQAIVALTSWAALVLFLGAAEPTVEKRAPQAFRFAIPNADLTDSGKLPFFRVFPGGKDRNDLDATSSLDSLKFARGESKLYREEDKKPGLIVVLRRVVFMPLPDRDYKAILEGEFNAVETLVKEETMRKLLGGERTEVVFDADTTKGIRPLAFRVKAKTKLDVALREGKLLIYGGEGNSSVTHFALTGDFSYESEPIAFGPAEDSKPIYAGWPVKPVIKSDGTCESLPIVN
jgi:hypothetical protein